MEGVMSFQAFYVDYHFVNIILCELISYKDYIIVKQLLINIFRFFWQFFLFDASLFSGLRFTPSTSPDSRYPIIVDAVLRMGCHLVFLCWRTLIQVAKLVLV